MCRRDTGAPHGNVDFVLTASNACRTHFRPRLRRGQKMLVWNWASRSERGGSLRWRNRCLKIGRMIMSKTASPNLQAQHAYVASKKVKGFKFGLTVGDAFVRGIRDLGYKSNANALAELVDNSIQAGASRADVLFGFERSDKKPAQIAVVDNGHGMERDMIRLAVMWGGTHREGDRS